MAIYFWVSFITIFIGVMLIVLGIILRKKISPTIMVALLLIGIFIVIVSAILSLCFGFFYVLT